MLKDFVVADEVAIRARGKYVDLHNEFELVQIRFSPQDRAAEFEFAAAKGRPLESPATVVLQFTDVDWIQVSPRTLSAGNGVVLELGYKEPSDSDLDWLLREEQASAEAHLVLRLSGDEFVRLHARHAKAVF